MAPADAFDQAFFLKHDLQRILGKPIPLFLLTDSKVLFDDITGNKYTTEACLMVDISALRQVYHDRTIPNIGLLSRHYNAADGLTKVAPNAALQKLMQTNKATHAIEHYIVDHMLQK